MNKRKEDLRGLFSDQLVHLNLGGADELTDVVDALLENVNFDMGWGNPGRSRVASELVKAHHDTFLEFFDMPEAQARALGEALVLLEFITAAEECNPDLKGEAGNLIDTSSEVSAARRHRIVLINTEWFPRNGGISTFNAKLARALAIRHKVACYLPKASEEEVEDAAQYGILLIKARALESQAFEARMLAGIPDELRSFQPDLIVGHDRHSGSIALDLKSEVFTEARTCVIAHTAPHRIEKFKTDRKSSEEIADGVATRPEHLATLLIGADIAFAVGPRLRFDAQHLAGRKAVVKELIPGVDIRSEEACDGSNRYILLFGRTEDARLKGVELAHSVLWKLIEKNKSRYAMQVRGIPETDLAAFVEKFPGFQRPSIYNPNPQVLVEDILGASLVLMPSLEEGFGLVAMEAIGLNRPVLVSSESGAAEYLREICPDAAERFIVDMKVPPSYREKKRNQILTDNWVVAIENIYKNWTDTQKDLQALRKMLASQTTWDATARGFESVCF